MYSCIFLCNLYFLDFIDDNIPYSKPSISDRSYPRVLIFIIVLLTSVVLVLLASANSRRINDMLRSKYSASWKVRQKEKNRNVFQALGDFCLIQTKLNTFMRLEIAPMKIMENYFNTVTMHAPISPDLFLSCMWYSFDLYNSWKFHTSIKFHMFENMS